MAWLPLHRAAVSGNADALRRELERGVSPNIADPYGFNPLDFAASPGGASGTDKLACVRLLIDAGANVSHASRNNKTALMHAAGGGQSTIVGALLDAGSDLNSRDHRHWTPLHHAMYSDGSADCARLLINAGAAVDARCDMGRTPLHHAAGQEGNFLDHRRLYPILLRAGATIPAELNLTDAPYYDAYLLKVIAAGGFRRYERAHLDAIAATLLPKLPSLPPEMVRRVVEYAFHVGDY